MFNKYTKKNNFFNFTNIKQQQKNGNNRLLLIFASICKIAYFSQCFHMILNLNCCSLLLPALLTFPIESVLLLLAQYNRPLVRLPD